jgi:hypothetical protein
MLEEDKTLRTIKFKNMEQYMFIVKVEHIIEGKVIQRELPCVPGKGDWIEIGQESFVVKNVSWNFSDRRTVTLLVDRPEF